MRGSLACYESVPAHRKIGLKSRCDRLSERHVPFLLTLSANGDRLRARANVIQIDADQLGVANAAAIKQFQDQAVALWESRRFRHFPVQHGIHLFDRRNARELFGQFRRGNERRWILTYNSLLAQPTIESALLRENAPPTSCSVPFHKDWKESRESRGDRYRANPVNRHMRRSHGDR